jgi:hypothetical protein
MRHSLLAALLAGVSCLAMAQLRSIPPGAKTGELRHVQDMLVELDGKPQRLAPGAQIRDPDNRLVLPVSLARKATVKYMLDGAGMVHRVWLLTPQEKAQADREKPKSKPPAKKT